MEDRDIDVPHNLLRAAVMAADSVAIDARQRPGVTNADITRAVVREAFACALGNGLIQVVPQDQWPQWIAVDPPYSPHITGD